MKLQPNFAYSKNNFTPDSYRFILSHLIMINTWASHLLDFYSLLSLPEALPPEVEVLHPQTQPAVRELTNAFFNKFYNDQAPRKLIMGINPGRLGAGITGINFTGPRQLRENCGIEHSYGNSSELSAEFIYEMIEEYGGAKKFYGDYFFSAVSPLGFTKNGKNINYYDQPDLQAAVTPFITECFDKQLSFGFNSATCYCIGEEKNFKFLGKLNENRRQQGLPGFETILPLPHPRFIMQYKRKEKDKYIALYLQKLHGL